jgi:hypothetical protein
MHSVPQRGIFALFAIAVIASGCGSRERQFEAEAQVIMRIVWGLEWHQAEHPHESITNLSHLVAAYSQKGYPYAWHDRFRRFGKHAGFKNSIYEKYIFLPPGIRGREIAGDAVMMNATPYPGLEGELQRSVVFRINWTYLQDSVSEAFVQQMFKEAGIPEPRPQVMPPPPPRPQEFQNPGPFTRFHDFFFGLVEAYGLSSHVAIPLWYCVLSLPFISVLGMVFWIRRRTHSRNRT